MILSFILVNRHWHEHTARTTSDLHFSRFARSSLWEHLSHFSATSYEVHDVSGNQRYLNTHPSTMMLTATNVF